MSAAENRLAHFRAIVEAEAVQAGGPDRTRYRAAYQAVAAATGLAEEYVYQLFKGKSSKAKIGDEAAAKLDRVYANGRARGWIDLPTANRVEEESPGYFVEPNTPSLQEAVYRLAEMLASLDDDGRNQASQALSTLAKGPERGAARAAEMLLTIERLHQREPQPDPPSTSPARAGETAAAARASGKARLTVKAGGGKKVQLALPFPAKTVADPWDTSQAPRKELDWYKDLKRPPKVKS